MSYTSGPEEITKGRSGGNTGLWVALVVAVGVACFLGGYLLAVLAEQKTADARRDFGPAQYGDTKLVDGRRVTTYRATDGMPPVVQQRIRPAVPPEELIVGKPFPNLEFTAIDGREVSIADMKGKVVVVEFWATWCGPCVKEMPRMKAIYEKWHDKGLEMVGISTDSDEQKLRDYVAENKIAWPQYFQNRRDGRSLSERFGIRGVPTIFLIDREGNVVSRDLRGAELERTLATMLSQDASEVAAAKAEMARIAAIKNVTVRGSRVEDEQGNWMEIAAIEPNSPATLAPGEKLHVKIRYYLVTEKPVQMWALPSKSTQRGDKSSPSDCYYRDEARTGIVDRWFFYDGVATVSEISVNMMDSESRKDMMTLVYECSAKWRAPEGQAGQTPAAGASEE